MNLLRLFTLYTCKKGLHNILEVKLMIITGRHRHIDQVLSLLWKNGVYCYGSLTRSGQQDPLGISQLALSDPWYDFQKIVIVDYRLGPLMISQSALSDPCHWYDCQKIVIPDCRSPLLLSPWFLSLLETMGQLPYRSPPIGGSLSVNSFWCTIRCYHWSPIVDW